DMGAYREAFRRALPATTALLAGIGGWHGDDSRASGCCFAGEDGPKRCPARLADGLCPMLISHPCCDPQIFEVDRIVLPQQQGRGLVVKLGALPLHLLVRALQKATALRRRLLPVFR